MLDIIYEKLPYNDCFLINGEYHFVSGSELTRLIYKTNDGKSLFIIAKKSTYNDVKLDPIDFEERSQYIKKYCKDNDIDFELIKCELEYHINLFNECNQNINEYKKRIDESRIKSAASVL